MHMYGHKYACNKEKNLAVPPTQSSSNFKFAEHHCYEMEFHVLPFSYCPSYCFQSLSAVYHKWKAEVA